MYDHQCRILQVQRLVGPLDCILHRPARELLLVTGPYEPRRISVFIEWNSLVDLVLNDKISHMGIYTTRSMSVKFAVWEQYSSLTPDSLKTTKLPLLATTIIL
jgi:hypothetical protein